MDILKFIIIAIAVFLQIIGVVLFILEFLQKKKNFGWQFFVSGIVLEIVFFCI